MSVPLNANSPSVGTLPLADQIVLDRFSKIESVNMRYKLSSKKNKVDDYPIRKPRAYSAQNLSVCLSNAPNNEDFKNDAWPLSKSLVGGSMNICKARVINFLRHPERIVQGSVMFHRLRSRMIVSEKPRDGTVAMYYGDIEDGDILAEEDHLPTLPNTHLADLLAAQYCTLMLREGFQVEDQLQAKPMRMNNASTSQPNPTAIPPTNSGVEMQQYADAVSGQVSGEVAKPTSSGPRQQMLPGSAGLSSMLGPNLSRGSNHNGAYGSDGSTKVDAGNQSLYEPAATTDSITANAAAATATATGNTAAATTAVTTITADTATAIAATATAATAAAVTATATTAAAARNNLPTASSGFTFTGRLTIDHGNSTDEPTNSVTATPAKSNESTTTESKNPNESATTESKNPNESTTTESKNPNEPTDEFRCNPCHKYW